MTQLVFEKFDKPVAESKYIVRVTSKVLNWRNFLYFSRNADLSRACPQDGERRSLPQGIQLQAAARHRPVHHQRSGRREGQQHHDPAAARTTGPRSTAATSVSTTSTRFSEIVVRDENLAFEMFKRGDLDYHYVCVTHVVGSGDELRPRSARADSEAQGLQRLSARALSDSRSIRGESRGTTSGCARALRICSIASC